MEKQLGRREVILLTALFWLPWLGLFLLVPPPAQNFPLDDDWAFAKGAFAICRGEGVHYQGWASMPQLGQWLWAYPFVAVLGPTHVALRLSTLVLSWLGSLALYDLLRREAGLSSGAAVFVATALAWNPLYFWLSGTFMTDVPALAFSLIALALYARAFCGGHIAYLLAATVVATLAVVTRQNALAAPLAVGVVLLRDPVRRKSPTAWLSVVLPIAVGLGTAFWLSQRNDIITRTPWVPVWQQYLVFPFITLQVLGVAAVPVLVGMRGAGSRFFILCLGYMAFFAVFAWQRFPETPLFPYLGALTPNAVNNYVYGAPWVGQGKAESIVLTVLGCLAGTVLCTRLTSRRNPAEWCRLLLVFAAWHVPFLLISGILYDRYFLVLLPGALAAGGIKNGESRPRLRLGWLVLVGFGIASFASMHDWLAWNAARWELGRRAVERGISATAIEGGFEWDGWHSPVPATLDPSDPQGKNLRPRGMAIPFNRALFPQLTGDYALSFVPLPGTRVVDTEPCRLWLAPSVRQCHLLARGP